MGGRIACKVTLCRFGVVSQIHTTSFSMDKTSSEVYTYILGSSFFADESRFNLRRSDGRNRVYRRKWSVLIMHVYAKKSIFAAAQ